MWQSYFELLSSFTSAVFSILRNGFQMELLVQSINVFLIFVELARWLFKILFLTIYICTSKVHTSLLPISLLTVDVITHFVSLMGIKWYFTLTLTCISLTKNAFQHLFTFEFAFSVHFHFLFIQICYNVIYISTFLPFVLLWILPCSWDTLYITYVFLKYFVNLLI